ncbi:MAG: DNA polymerase Y family protein, partial [Salinisphaera sp.]|nr:DNA polymerase Y family protein [Salinisphaera sp.]
MWLCLHLPNCALEAATRYLPAEDAPMAVVAAERGRRRVIAVNDVARQCGVAPGQWLTAARARAPALLALQHDPRAQDRLLRELAARCLTYSSHVHRPDPPPEPGAGRLLLEIGASLRLFGGRARLQEMLEENLAQAGHEVFLGAGRTPTLAMLRARAGAHGQRVTKTHRLPLVLLELPPATLESLTAAGLTTVGEVLALSRAAVGHRYGPDCLSYLDRLTGRAPDPRPALAWPQRFAVKLELSAEAIDTQALGFVLERLVTDLGAALRGADAAVVALHLTLEHAGRTPTRVNLGFTAPTSDPARITSLLATRLDTQQLPAPERAL